MFSYDNTYIKFTEENNEYEFAILHNGEKICVCNCYIENVKKHFRDEARYILDNFKNDNFFYVLYLRTIPEYRNLGLAKKLMKFIINKAKELGYTELYLMSYSLEKNSMSSENLLKFYKSLGFEEIYKYIKTSQLILNL